MTQATTAQNQEEEDARALIEAFMRALEEHPHDPGTLPTPHAHVAPEGNAHASEFREFPFAFTVHATLSSREPSGAKTYLDQEKREREAFIPLFFANAPRIHNNSIIAERKSW